VTRKHATNAQFVDALERARRTIRARASEASTSASAQDGLRELMSTVGFVRASTGRRGRRMFGEDARAKTLERDGGGGARRYVVRDGALVEEGGVGAAANRVASGILSHEDAWKYHNKLIDRQHYGRRLKKFKPEPL
jgi:coproporphyrinogen III oxidase